MNPAFASALQSRRDDYNARFLHARRLRPELDGDGFKRFLSDSVQPLAASVHALDPGAVDGCVSAAYDVALELCAQRLAGPAALSPWITQGWSLLLPGAARFLRDAPQRVLVSVSNALHHLSAVAPAGPALWLERMRVIQPLCTSLDEWLKAGQVISWLAGLAHYRAAALNLLASLTAAQQRVALGLAESVDSARTLTELALDPWFHPAQPAPSLHAVTTRIGGFSGFGGPFKTPPQVAANGESLLVRAGADAWELHLDAFGHSLNRIPLELFDTAPAARLPAGWVLTGTQLRIGSQTLDLRGAGAITAFASNAHTLLVCHAASHQISVIAVRP